MVFLLLAAVFFCLLYLPQVLQDSVQCYFLSPPEALPYIRPVHLIRCLFSLLSELCVHTSITALVTVCQNLFFTCLSQAGWGAAQGQGPEYSTVAWGPGWEDALRGFKYVDK